MEIEVEEKPWGWDDIYTLHYRGMVIKFVRAEVCRDIYNDDYIDRICHLKWQTKQGHWVTVATLKEYELVRKIEEMLPERSLKISRGLEEIE